MSPDIAASVRARLLKQARQSGEEFERTLARFGAERIVQGESLHAAWLTAGLWSATGGNQR